MSRLRTLIATLFILTAISGCDILESGADASDFDAAELTGVTFIFRNPNATGGEFSAWKYSFQAGQVSACNSSRPFTANDWKPEGTDAVRVGFGPPDDPYRTNAWELYTFSNISGSLADGTAEGDFTVLTDINSASGHFGQFPVVDSDPNVCG